MGKKTEEKIFDKKCLYVLIEIEPEGSEQVLMSMSLAGEVMTLSQKRAAARLSRAILDEFEKMRQETEMLEGALADFEKETKKDENKK